ncbi:MAG: hypothetical protein FWE40_00515 [Oscillospiraceae bacterium]|nr:hypothetical protein [Oscillospiraceae bacterium]
MQHPMNPGETREQYAARMELYALLEEGRASGNGMPAGEFFAQFWEEKEVEFSQRYRAGSRA